MAITKAEILAATQRRLGAMAAIHNIDAELAQVLHDLSRAGNFLPATTTVATVASTASYTEPSQLKQVKEAYIADQYRLAPWTWRDYQRAIEGAGSNPTLGTPAYYTPWNGRLYLYPCPDTVYTLALDYYKYHAASVATIEFADTYREAILEGLLKTLWLGQFAGHPAANAESMKHLNLYQQEISRQRGELTDGPRFTRYYDL